MNQGNPSGVTKDLRDGRCACEWSGDRLKVVCFAHLGAVREFDASEKKPAAGCYYTNALHDTEGVANMHAESAGIRPVAVYLATDYDALTDERDQLKAQRDRLLAMVRRYASECAECDGNGAFQVWVGGAVGWKKDDCYACAHIRILISEASK